MKINYGNGKLLIIPIILPIFVTLIYRQFGKINTVRAGRFFSDLLPPSPDTIIDPSSKGYEWTNILQNNYQIIQEEYENFKNVTDFEKIITIQQTDYMLGNTQKGESNLDLNKGGGWSLIGLRVFGQDTDLQKKYFPKTMKLIQDCDKLAKDNLFQVMFSIFKNQRSLEPHKGPYKGIIRYHLGIEIKQHNENQLYLSVWPNSHNKVYDEIKNQHPIKLRWNNGTHILFDDTAWHGVTNTLENSYRVVLWVDIPRNDLSFLRRILNKFILSLPRWLFTKGKRFNKIQNELVSKYAKY